MERPSIVKDEHLAFLTSLRNSGCFNMFGVSGVLADEFDLPKRDARAILTYWMESFTEA